MAAVRFGFLRAFALVLAVAGVLLVVPTASAVPLPPTPNPLPSSTFQGGDGNQAPESGFADWATLQADGKVERSPDPNAQDSAFAGGRQNNAPGEWYFVSSSGGVTPASDNILDSWSSVEILGANTFLYLAAAREAGTGTTYLAFELNRDGQLWDNGRARVPCRRDGDVLVTFQSQGNAVSLFVETWRTSTFDPATGCARTGSLSDAASVVANVDVQGAVNPAAIANSLPGSLNPIPAAQFGETAVNLGTVLAAAVGSSCGAFASVWAHSRASRSDSAQMKDFVAPHAINARRCSAAGTKWLDHDADGARDPGDAGLAGFRIYADLDDNGEYNLGEPFAITDEHGDYVIDEIRATGEYTLREEPTGAAPEGPWTCSHPSPCEWTVDPAAEPFAQGRDFGNWRPAHVTVTKKVDPPDDPGRFDLSVGSNLLPAAGHGDSETFSVRPGTHAVAETPAAGTEAEDYESSLACSPVSERATWLRGVTSTTVTVVSGQHVECTFVNVRRGTPSVTMDKVAPASAVHGDTLRYELAVVNTGSVAFAADDVAVRDRRCDARPELVEQLDQTGATDTTTESLDPGDTWIYACNRATEPREDPDDCQPDTVSNTGRVTVPGASDRDTTATELVCPPPRRPGVAMQKVGPETADAGTALPYVLYVTNIGEVPFAEADVEVLDPACDAPPELVARLGGTGKADATSPEQLDPDDVWVYRCTHTTADPSADCQPSVVTNTSTVIATSRRPTVQDSDTFDTLLTCPPTPTAPPPPPPQPPAPPPPPEPPVPVVPAGVVPSKPPRPALPTAGVAGRANLQPLRGCLKRGSPVIVRGRRIATISVRVRGRRIGGLRVRALQRRAIIRVARNLAPGRLRVTAVIRFQRGADTPTVRLTRVARACAPAQAPRFTG